METVTGLRPEAGMLQGLSLPQPGGGPGQDGGQVRPAAQGGGEGGGGEQCNCIKVHWKIDVLIEIIFKFWLMLRFRIKLQS